MLGMLAKKHQIGNDVVKYSIHLSLILKRIIIGCSLSSAPSDTC